jgi:HAD superfamily hydrolase (TIGR01509 family)
VQRKESQRMQEGVIFDMDGVLFDTERLYQEVWKELAEENGYQLDAAFPKRIAGTSGRKTNEVLEEFFPGVDSDRMIEECRRRMEKRLQAGAPMKRGVREILTFLKKSGVKIAIASSNRREMIERNLEKAGIRMFFDQIACGADVQHGKPAPDIFLLAAERLNLAPEHCYVFEDGFNGVRAADAAGCRCIMVPDLFQPDEEIREKSFAVCTSLIDAMEAMQNGEL